MNSATAPVLDARLEPPANVLRGPADADHFRVQVGRYGDRWYHDPLPADSTWGATTEVFPSVSIVKKASGSDWSFVTLGRVNEYLKDPQRMAAFTAATPDQRYEIMKMVNRLGLEAAGRRGSNVHLMAEGRLYRMPDGIGPDDPGAEYRNAINDFFDRYQPELIAAEFVCVHRTLNGAGYGGTCDALLTINGSPAWVDWKSRGVDSNHAAYAEEAAQLAAYARAEYMIVESPHGPARQAIPQSDTGYIVSVKPDGCRLYPIDLDAAFKHWTALHAWWLARRSEKDPIGRQLAPGAKPATRSAQRAEITTEPAEGAAVPDDTFAPLQAAYADLPAAGIEWIKELTSQAAQALVPFHAKGNRTTRRFHIINALVSLVKDGSTDDETVRAFLEPIIGEPSQWPTIPLGHLIGSLSATEAEQFSGVIDGRYVIVLSSDGRPTLQPAA